MTAGVTYYVVADRAGSAADGDTLVIQRR